MTLYRYVKAPPSVVKTKSIKPRISSKLKNNLAKLLLVSGLLIIASVLTPIIYYELFTAPNLKQQTFLSPIPVIGIGKNEPQSEARTNYTQPKNWFPQAQYPNIKESKYIWVTYVLA